jgi:hypothetical protein
MTVGLKTTPRTPTATPTRPRLENEAESATRMECVVT